CIALMPSRNAVLPCLRQPGCKIRLCRSRQSVRKFQPRPQDFPVRVRPQSPLRVVRPATVGVAAAAPVAAVAMAAAVVGVAATVVAEALTNLWLAACRLGR